MIGIGDFDARMRSTRKTVTKEGQVMYRGKKYVREKSTGYYVCSTGGRRKRLHVDMWEAEHGVSVPPGSVIHHIDWNKSHNTPENLICVTLDEHNMIHNPPSDLNNLSEYQQKLYNKVKDLGLI